MLNLLGQAFAWLLSFGLTAVTPIWTINVDSVQCINAVYEHHFVNNHCDVTTCKFPEGEFMVFVECGEGELSCKVFDDEMAECPLPQ